MRYNVFRNSDIRYFGRRLPSARPPSPNFKRRMYRYEKDPAPHPVRRRAGRPAVHPVPGGGAGGLLPAGERRAGDLHRRRPQEDIVWDGETQTVTASKDGAAISLTVGDSAVTWTGPSWSQTSEDGTSGSAGGSGGIAYLDTAPYIDPATNRTYIPVGLVADILGCRVAWDGETSTVIIDDVDAILAENTETYELMDQYLDYARKYSIIRWRALICSPPPLVRWSPVRKSFTQWAAATT